MTATKAYEAKVYESASSTHVRFLIVEATSVRAAYQAAKDRLRDVEVLGGVYELPHSPDHYILSN